MPNDPTSLDPRAVRMLKDLTLVKQLFDGLMRIDANNIPQPAIASHVEISEDLLTYTFHLREALWTNGDPVTAYDFVYAWTTVLDPAFATDYAYMLYPIKNAKRARAGECSLDAIGIFAPNERRLVVRLEEPTPYFLELTAFPTFFPINSKVDKKSRSWAHAPGENFVSNGPFMLESWHPESKMEMVKNSTYWDKKNVRLAALSFSVINDNNSEALLFEKNALDWLGSPISQNIATDLIATMKQRGALESFPVAGTFWFKFNTAQSPFDHAKLRRAFSYAINRNEIIQHILQGNEAVATGPLPPSMQIQPVPFYEDGQTTLAKTLFEEALAENGWTRETFPKVVLHHSPSDRINKIVQLVQHQWKNAFDIEIKLESMEMHLYRRNIREGNYQVGTGEWIADFNDPIAFLELFQFPNQEGNGMNDTGWYREDFADLLVKSRSQSDLNRRRELLVQAEKILIEEMPIAPVYHYAFDYIKKEGIKNVILSPLGTADFKFATIE